MNGSLGAGEGQQRADHPLMQPLSAQRGRPAGEGGRIPNETGVNEESLLDTEGKEEIKTPLIAIEPSAPLLSFPLGAVSSVSFRGYSTGLAAFIHLPYL